MIDYNIKEFRHRFREAINALTDDWPYYLEEVKQKLEGIK